MHTRRDRPCPCRAIRACVALTAAVLAALAAHPAAARGQCSATSITPPDWRTTLGYPYDAFFATTAYTPDEPRWVKFTILLCDPGTVYFQDSRVHRFHYDFARARLRPFSTFTRAQFDAATLHAAGQAAVLGAVLVPGSGLFGESNPAREAAVQLVRQDAYTREQVRDYVNLVKSRMVPEGGGGGGGGPGVPVLYFPTFEQQASAEADRAWLAEQGVEVSGPARWIRGHACYAQGWAVGTLKFVTGAQVGEAYRAGTLRHDDILITDGVPAEVPPVAGIISLAPATPSSHVAILSQTWGIPFVYITDVRGEASAAMAAVGRRVVVRSYADPVFGGCNAAVVDIQDSVGPELLAEMLAMKATPPLAYTPTAARGAYSLGVDSLTTADIRYVGGKAANYGVLRRAIPAQVRPAVALTFDLWDAFLGQTLTGGQTLREHIRVRLLPYSAWPPADTAALSAELAGIRTLFTSTTTTGFTPALESAVLSALQNPAYGFDPDVKIRFRSSTNVEDAANFTGAGLYDSFSGCLRDDLDGDTTGPSACEPEEAQERGVFRAIRKVFASFYNDNAYQARIRLGVSEADSGMAVLCHHSFPDPTELANGVAILTWRQPQPWSSMEARIVTQLGATSVSNPEDGSTPEEVGIYMTTANIYPELERTSSRVILGQTVMTWEDDYTRLASLMRTVANRYAMENGLTEPFTLDFEFKKTLPVGGGAGGIEIKQVRPLPVPSTAPSITPVLIDRPQRWCLFQGETADVFANHRLKAEMLLSTDSERLTAANLSAGFLADAQLRFNTGCRVAALSGRPSAFPGSSWTFAGGTAAQRWRVADAPNPRTYTLTVESVPTLLSPQRSPVVWLTDFGQLGRHLIRLRADYDRPVVSRDWLGQPTTTLTEEVALCPCPSPVGLPVERTVSHNGITVTTAFSWVPGGAAAGYTFDLASWGGTTITGLTTRPITLRSPWSQTYRPGHHNFTEEFIFDPRLEPGIAPAVLQELRALGVAYLLVEAGSSLVPPITLIAEDCLPCPVDFDASGSVTVQDLFDYLAAYFASEPRADWDGSGGATVQDLFEFLRHWFAGC